MKKTSNKKRMILLAAMVALAAVLFAACSSQPSADKVQTPVSQGDAEGTEAPAIPLATNYIVLSYPAELEQDVTVSYENLKDGQLIRFTTDFTGEELELFSFSISTSGDDGYTLGTLEDPEAGSLMVCMHVKEYTEGNWKPEDFNKLNAMQERVNDIIVQFYEDERFVPSH